MIPTAGKITTLRLLKNLQAELTSLQKAFEGKAKEFDGIIKMGRTQMQDAVPVRLGQEFRAYADSVNRGIQRIEKVSPKMTTLNMGGTAIGTGINADEVYFKNIVPLPAHC